VTESSTDYRGATSPFDLASAEYIFDEDISSRESGKRFFSYHAAPAASADGAGVIERGVEEAYLAEAERVSSETPAAAASAAATNSALADRDAGLAPFFGPLVITAPQVTSPVQSQPRACVPVLEHILATAMDALADLFSAHNLSKPCAWDDISARHLEVMHVLMGDMHKGLGDATLEVSRLILKPESMKRFRRGERLDDHCLDRMLEYLVQATGSKMVGVKEDATCSPWVTTDSTLASLYYVLGIAHAESLRRLGKKPKAAACDTSPAHQQHASGESWVVPGETETPDETLRRVVRDIVGSGNVDAALGKSLDPFGKRNILVVATCSHTPCSSAKGRGRRKHMGCLDPQLPGQDKMGHRSASRNERTVTLDRTQG
jgi:hypothetical protein